MPTIEQFTTTTTRAARLTLRVLIVATSHVELIDADTGRTVGRVGAWAEVAGWLEEKERIMRRKRAA